MNIPDQTALPVATDIAESCNRDCRLAFTDRERLRHELEEIGGLPAGLLAARPHLFSDTAVFVARRDLRRMAALVAAVDAVVATPGYRAAALARAPAIAAHDPGSPGAFVSYDFHLSADGPRLIEINTNAGGALLGAALARAQDRCCPGMGVPATSLDRAEDTVYSMIEAEWRRRNGGRPLKTVAIVDDDPPRQYLYPEFLLFERLFRERGLRAVIADAAELRVAEGGLRHGGERIDLVYNRLVDFSLAESGHAALRTAYLEDLAVVTPHPRAHALYADKRNLILLGDGERLRDWGVGQDEIDVLATAIPTTEPVCPEQADALWRRRDRLFFKPATGYGSRAAYRGDKLTRRVWGEILAGNYVAQSLVPPPERRLRVGGAEAALKFDLRAFAYAGRVQMLVARLYQGQTTNFKTPGGGLAAVFVTGEGAGIPGE